MNKAEVNLENLLEYIRTANLGRGKCLRRNITCLLLTGTNILISTGINCSPEKDFDCYETPCEGSKLPRGENTTAGDLCKCSIHAETQALNKLRTGHEPHVAIINCPPCSSCVNDLFVAGVKKIYIPSAILDRDNSKAFCEKQDIEWLAYDE